MTSEDSPEIGDEEKDGESLQGRSGVAVQLAATMRRRVSQSSSTNSIQSSTPSIRNTPNRNTNTSGNLLLSLFSKKSIESHIRNSNASPVPTPGSRSPAGSTQDPHFHLSQPRMNGSGRRKSEDLGQISSPVSSGRHLLPSRSADLRSFTDNSSPRNQEQEQDNPSLEASPDSARAPPISSQFKKLASSGTKTGTSAIKTLKKGFSNLRTDNKLAWSADRSRNATPTKSVKSDNTPQSSKDKPRKKSKSSSGGSRSSYEDAPFVTTPEPFRRSNATFSSLRSPNSIKMRGSYDKSVISANSMGRGNQASSSSTAVPKNSIPEGDSKDISRLTTGTVRNTFSRPVNSASGAHFPPGMEETMGSSCSSASSLDSDTRLRNMTPSALRAELEQKEAQMNQEVPNLLEAMNLSSENVNIFESKLSEEEKKYDELLGVWKRMHKDARMKYGSNIDRAWPYFEADSKLRAVTNTVQNMVKEYGDAVYAYDQAKVTLEAIEARHSNGGEAFGGQKSRMTNITNSSGDWVVDQEENGNWVKTKLDGASQDKLSQATMRVMVAQQQRDHLEAQYAKVLNEFQNAQIAEEERKKEVGLAIINKTRTYFQQIETRQKELRIQQKNLEKLDQQTNAAKYEYQEALEGLENINNVIHSLRQRYKRVINELEAAEGTKINSGLTSDALDTPRDPLDSERSNMNEDSTTAPINKESNLDTTHLDSKKQEKSCESSVPDPERSPERTTTMEGEVTYKVSVHAPEKTPITVEEPTSSPKESRAYSHVSTASVDVRRFTEAVGTFVEVEEPQRVVQESFRLLDPAATLQQPREWDSMIKDEGPTGPRPSRDVIEK